MRLKPFEVIPVESEQAPNKQVKVFLKHERPKVWCEGSGSVEILKNKNVMTEF